MNNSTPNSNKQKGGAEKTASAPRWIIHPKYCPECGNGQPVSDRCAYCGISFSSNVADESDVSPGNELNAGGVSSAKPGIYSLSAPIKAFPVILGKMSQRVRVIALSLLLVSIVSLVAGIAQYRSHLKRHYLQNYVLALYGIKSGMEMTGRICEGKYKVWREGVSSASPASGAIDPRTLADLKSVKVEIDSIMVKVGDPPKEYNQAAGRLQDMYSIYDKINALIIKSPDSLSRHTPEIVAAGKSFSLEIENLKANMPVPLADEFRKAGQKYDLRFLGLEK
ncbi:MAG TPA: hypothetical protein VHN12_01205 [Geobacteraceae bacterium]|nr:hypothetical protein [Geobacteraceae bacterium]